MLASGRLLLQYAAHSGARFHARRVDVRDEQTARELAAGMGLKVGRLLREQDIRSVRFRRPVPSFPGLGQRAATIERVLIFIPHP